VARLFPLAHYLAVSRGILFDTTALLELFQYEGAGGAPSPLLVGIHPERRYTSVVNMFEFICNQPRDVVRNRRSWLENSNIMRLPVTREISTTFLSLLHDSVGCHLRNDLLIAATAKREALAVASRDADFRDIEGVLCVAEFAV
jgi:predicted nucleic acid-binding protein